MGDVRDVRDVRDVGDVRDVRDVWDVGDVRDVGCLAGPCGGQLGKLGNLKPEYIVGINCAILGTCILRILVGTWSLCPLALQPWENSGTLQQSRVFELL